MTPMRIVVGYLLAVVGATISTFLGHALDAREPLTRRCTWHVSSCSVERARSSHSISSTPSPLSRLVALIRRRVRAFKLNPP